MSELTTRISDAERGQAVELLDGAVADGRITWAEHAERSDLVWAARTKGELAPVLADLGRAKAGTGVPVRVTAKLSKIIRTPDPGRPVQAQASLGAVVLDLSTLRDGDEVHVEASSWLGKVALTVPAATTVIDSGSVFLGTRKVIDGSGAAGGPVVHLTGRSTLGTVKVFRR